ncbi:MAG: AMP-binding protein [Nitrospirales bacterium]
MDTLVDLIKSLQEGGDSPAIISLTKGGNRTWSFKQLAETSQQLARGFRKADLSPGSHAILLAPNRPEWITVACGLICAGVIPVPIDPQMGKEDLTHVLADSEGKWIFTTSTILSMLQEQGLDKNRNIVLLDVAARHQQSWEHFIADPETADPPISSKDQAMLFYTSGTSGRPKGVPLTHGNLISNLQALLALNLIHKNDRLFVPLPFHHVYPFTIGLLLSFATKIPLILPHSLTGPQLLRALREGRPTVMLGIPRIYEALYAGIEKKVAQRGSLVAAGFRIALGLSTFLRRRLRMRIGRTLFSAIHREMAPLLQILVSGGSALHPEVAWKLEGLGWRIGTGYGLTETSPILTLNKPGEGHLETAGQALPGVEVKIAEPRSQDQHGEVLAKGPNVFLGYRNLPEKTKKAFTEDGYFRTGDLGEWQGNHLKLVGRSSSMIVLSGGENIRPDTIEEILDQGRTIQESSVLERDDRLVALIVPTSRLSNMSREEITQQVEQDIHEAMRQLPSHHRLANFAISFDPLPRTRLGKLRRHKLSKLYEQAKQGKGVGDSGEKGAMPIDHMSGEDQQLLSDPQARQAWDWLSSRFHEIRLTPDSTIQMDLGVDSLEWVNLSLEIQETIGVEVDQDTIGRIETVRDFLQVISEAEDADTGSGLTRHLQDPRSLLNESQRAWLTPLTPFEQFLSHRLSAFNRWLMHTAYHVKAVGLEHLPREEQFILIANHVSLLDPLAIDAVLSEHRLREIYWGGWTEVMFRNVLMRGVSRLARVLPIDPQRGALSNLAVGLACLEDGHNLVWFPEGERSRNGRLQPFQTGIGLILEQHPVPVIPMWITGTYAAWPPHHRFPRSGSISIEVGRPLSIHTLKNTGNDNRPHQNIVNGLHQELINLSGGNHDKR